MSTELTKPTQLSWRKFLLTEAGVQGMLILREKAPSVHKGNADEIIFEAGRAQGYRDCLDQISEVIGVESKKDIDISND